MRSIIPPTKIIVQGTDKIGEGSGFLYLQGNGSGIFTDEGIVVVSEKRMEVYKGRKKMKGILGSSRHQSKGKKARSHREGTLSSVVWRESDRR